MAKPNPTLILVDVSGSIGFPGKEWSHAPTPAYNNGVGKIMDYGWLKEAVVVRRLMKEAKIRGSNIHLYEFGLRGREVEMRPGFVNTHESILEGYDYVPLGTDTATNPERAVELAKTKVKGPVDLFVVTDGHFYHEALEKAIGSYASKVTIIQVMMEKDSGQNIPKKYGWDIQQYAAETKKQSRAKVQGVVNPRGVTAIYGTPIDFKALPEKITIGRRVANGKFKLEAHYPAKHFNDKQTYVDKRKEGSYCRFYDKKSPFFIARTVWDATSQPGMHMIVKNRGETHRFIVTPKVDDPTKASVIGSYLVHRDNGDPVLCSGVIGELEAAGDDGDFKVTPYQNHGIRCPKFDSDKQELSGHIPKTFEYKKSTKPRGPRKTAADYCKPAHTFQHPTDIKKAEMIADMDDEMDEAVSCLKCRWDGSYEDLVFVDADGSGGGGYDFHLVCPVCENDEWLDDMMAESVDEPCFSCDGIGHWDDGDCGYCAGSGLMSDTLRAEMAMFNNEYFDADCGCFKKAEGKVWGEKLISGWSGSNLGKKKADTIRSVPLDKYEEVYGMSYEELLESYSNLEVDDYKRCLMAMRKKAETSHLKKYGAEGDQHECITCAEPMGPNPKWSCECCGFLVGTQDDHEGCGDNMDGTVVCNHCYQEGHEVTTMVGGNEVIFNSTCKGWDNEKHFGDREYEVTNEYVLGAESQAFADRFNEARRRSKMPKLCVTCGEDMSAELLWGCQCCGMLVATHGDHEGCGEVVLPSVVVCKMCIEEGHEYSDPYDSSAEKHSTCKDLRKKADTSKPFFWNGMPEHEFMIKSGEVAEWMMQYEYGPTEDWWVWKGDGPEDPDDPDEWGYVDTGAEGRYLGVIEFIKKLNGYPYDEVPIGNLDIDDKLGILGLEWMEDATPMKGLWTNEPTISEDYDSLTFEAPYAGAGALMGIKGDSALSSFTPSELTESSAIHGDFDQASLNYSGHQNLEVRAESFAADECNDCGTVMEISPCCETSYCPSQDFDCDCEKHYDPTGHDYPETDMETGERYGNWEWSDDFWHQPKNAETLGKDSCCCGATKSKPCACMKTGAKCSGSCACSTKEAEYDRPTPKWAKPLGLIGGLAAGYISAQMIDNTKE